MTQTQAGPGTGKVQVVEVFDLDHGDLVNQLLDLTVDEDSDLWRHMGELVEGLAPGISPFDRREFVAEALAPVRAVFSRWAA